MSNTTTQISPLHQRMIDDMTLRKLSPKTQGHYIRAVKRFAEYLGCSPHRASAEDLRRYQLHLVSSGTSRFERQCHADGVAILLRRHARAQ